MAREPVPHSVHAPLKVSPRTRRSRDLLVGNLPRLLGAEVADGITAKSTGRAASSTLIRVPPQNAVDRTIIDVSTLGVKLALRQQLAVVQRKTKPPKLNKAASGATSRQRQLNEHHAPGVCPFRRDMPDTSFRFRCDP